MPQFYSEAADDELTYERCESFGGGMDAFTRSTLLPPDAFQYGENIFIPDNLEGRTRAGADKVATQLTKIQGLQYFDTPSIKQLITADAGKFYYTDSALAAWTEMTGFTLADSDVAFSSAQGIDKLLVTGGTAGALRIWNGTTWEAAATGATDPPTGATVVLWHAGRMWAAGFTGGTTGKESDAICVSALLTFGAGDWNLTDRSFRVGNGNGDPVIGLVSIPASVPEQEVLGVLKQNSIHIVRTDPTVAPTSYSDTTNPETVSQGIGVVGKRAFAVLGNDLLFVASDRSFRSLQRMEAAAAQYQVDRLPMSTPMQPYIDRINWTYASTIAVVRYRQLALFALPLDNATSPNYVFVWNGRLQRWVGIWSGWTPNCWAISRFGAVQQLMHGDNSGRVRKWKDTSDPTDDSTYLDDGADIATKLWSRSFLFGEPLNLKDAYHVEGRFSSSNAVVEFTLVADNAAIADWTKDLRPTGPNLEINLEFDLINSTNIPARKGLRGLTPFSECYLKVESTSGWWSLRSLSMSAFLNTLANE